VRSLLKTIVLMTLLLAAAGVVYSQAGVSAQDTASGAYKIGVVNRKKVFDEYTLQKQEFEKLKKEMESMQADIDKLQKEVEDLEATYRNQRETMAQAERQKMEEDIAVKKMTYQTEFRKLQGVVDTRTRNLFDRLKSDIDEVVREIGAKEDFHMILDGDPDPPSGTAVLFYSSTIDITSKVIDKINAK
jgi:Skp family chaperone for outer membrane proteins